MRGFRFSLSNLGTRLRSLGGGTRTLWRGVRVVSVSAPGSTALYVALMVILGLVPVVQTWLAREVVNDLAGKSWSGELFVFAGAYVLTLVLLNGLQPLQFSLSSWMESRAVGVIDRELMRAGARLTDLYRIERPEFGDELRTLQDSMYSLQNLLPLVQRAVTALIGLVGVLVLVGGLNPLLPVALVLVTIPHLRADQHLFILRWQAMDERSRPAREMDYCVQVSVEPDTAKELRIFGTSGYFLDRFRERIAPALREMDRLRFRQLGVTGAFSALHALVLAGGFWYVAREAGAGALTVGDVALYLNAIVQAQSQFGSLRWALGQLYGLQLSLGRFFEFIDTAAPRIALPTEGKGRNAPRRLRSGIELAQVSFSYPESDKLVLEDISFTLEANKVTALVGANGAGKSTLVKLLTRMYDPTEGRILLDGVPYQEYELESLRGRIAVVYQDFAHFALSLRDNIAVAAFAQQEDEHRVESAARWSGADRLVEKLPNGYDTELTRRYEGGVEPSGGEWQKIALARGVVRDAALVILDEPTSALDAEAEYELFERFRELMEGRTGLLISHRFSTVRMADQIVVLEDGAVLETGSHQELVLNGGRYAELFEMQAGRYK